MDELREKTRWYAPSNITYKLEKQDNLERTAYDNSDEVTININPNKKYQSILGIGTSIEESTVYCLSRMSEITRREVLTKLVDVNNGIGMNLIRVCIGTPE